MKRKRGQSILEYTLLLAVIIGIVVWAIFNLIKPKTEEAYNRTSEGIGRAQNETMGHGIFNLGGGGGGVIVPGRGNN